MMRKLLMAACAVLAMTGAAHGAEIKQHATIGNWKIYAWEENCSAHSDHANNTTLVMGLSVNKQFWFRIASSEWKIPSGEYPVIAFIDKVEIDWSNAIASGDKVTLPLELSQETYNLVARGAVMRVFLGDAIYNYPLTWTSGAISSLVECVGKITKAANPFSGHSTTPSEPISTPSNPFKRT